MCKLANATESQEWTETKRGGRMSVNQCVTNQNTILIMLENDLFFEDNTTYALKCSRHLITIKLTNVLMAERTKIIALVLVQTEIEFSAMLNHRNIERT